MTSFTNPKNRVFLRIFIIFLIIIALIYGLGLSLYTISANTVENYLFETIKSQISVNLQKFEISLKRIRGIQEELSNNEDVLKYALLKSAMRTSDRYDTVLDIEQILISLGIASEYIADARIYFPRNDQDISAAAAVSKISKEEWNKFISKDTSKKLLTYIDDRLYSLFTFPMSLSAEDPIFISVLEISIHEIKKSLSELKIPINSQVQLININQGWSITDPEQSMKDSILESVMKNIKKGINSDVIQSSETGSKLIIAYEYSQSLDSCLIWSAEKNEIFTYIPRIRMVFVIFSLISILAIPLFSVMVLRTVHFPLLDLVTHFNEMEKGNLGIQVAYHGDDEFRYLSDAFNSMSGKLKQLFDQVYSQELLLKDAELKRLHSQINPHFLYNSLYVIYRIIKSGDQDLAAQLTQKLSAYYQFITRESVNTVTLEQEVAHGALYAEIQSIRFDGGISVDISTLFPAEYSTKPCPCLMLQPILENCYIHGLKDRTTNGRISISFEQQADSFQIAVEDNGNLITEQKIIDLKNQITTAEDSLLKTKKSTGLRNIHRRIQLMYGDKYGLQFNKSSLGGLKVTIVLDKEDSNA